ncbi:hypothetical protein NCU01679 [Neurospora crassa OR74A]|uniref:Myocyte-specific enhancer factor 2d n=1 Tax=Neurospora crassa (strain ATCC 24698 / 74-OR23-1A / CBS 708.71 / DSM 1257 / FGSC 987) TaxID=367110 RepID=V5IPI1_NEUCR|nr:hypothetical protein NCU01679 [Neurospora crassa OR74A]ESA43640.1 hypothetical protein NCU01679 [Neurospora crassa OR74A]|eukprot:XP_011393482.1 hypothetical protein NCU01679 [Neurospora crassa OR74A]
MPVELPGFYFDPEKGKYFKIEDNKTAPTTRYTSNDVKRRRLLEEKKRVEEEKEKRLLAFPRKLKRAKILEDPLLGGFLERETTQHRPVVHNGGDDDTVIKSWARGLTDKGKVDLWPDLIQNGIMIGTISHLWVGGSDSRTGLGVTYAAVDDDSLTSSYIPRDGADEVNFAYANVRYRRTDFMPMPETISIPQLSSLRFHEPSGRMFLTSRMPTRTPSIAWFSPSQSEPPIEEEERPTWQLGNSAPNLIKISAPTPKGTKYGVINTSCPAPSYSRLTCIAGGDVGLLQLTNDSRLSWLTKPPPPSSSFKANHDSPPPMAKHGEVLSLDFLTVNPAEVVLVGGRTGRVCVLDMRVPDEEWGWIKHPSSAAHVRSVGSHGVLVAGPMSAMRLYDIRWCKTEKGSTISDDGDGTASIDTVMDWQPSRSAAPGSSSSSSSSRNTKPYHNQRPQQHRPKTRTREPPPFNPLTMSTPTTPILTFPSYRNAENIHIGFDVLSAPHYTAYNLAAAAHDDGTVGLYSLLDGSRVSSKTIDRIGFASGFGNGGLGQDDDDDDDDVDAGPNDVFSRGNVIKSLMFQTLPGDRHPSLFVGEGPRIKKYSFGVETSKWRRNKNRTARVEEGYGCEEEF